MAIIMVTILVLVLIETLPGIVTVSSVLSLGLLCSSVFITNS